MFDPSRSRIIKPVRTPVWPYDRLDDMLNVASEKIVTVFSVRPADTYRYTIVACRFLFSFRATLASIRSPTVTQAMLCCIVDPTAAACKNAPHPINIISAAIHRNTLIS